MSWDNFDIREGSHYGGEMYKKEVIRYYQTLGYEFRKTSTHEGSLEDLVFEKGNEKRLYVEAKSSGCSIFAKTDKLREEIFKYFVKWLDCSLEKRFELHLFAQEITKHEETQRVLTHKAIPNYILEWFNNRGDLDFDAHERANLDNATKEDIIEFFKSISVKLCSGYKLHNIIIEREDIIRRAPTSYAFKLLKEIKNRQLPVEKRTKVIVNFLELEYPQIFYQIESKYKTNDTIRKKLNPNNEFILHTPYIMPYDYDPPILFSFDSDLEPLNIVTKGEKVEISINELHPQMKRQLLYEHLRRYLFCKGLTRDKNKYYFAFEEPLNLELSDDNIKIEISREDGGLKTVTRALIKNNRLNFVEHRCIEIELGEIDNKIGLVIWSSFIFTYDGVRSIIRDEHASKIASKYLTPDYNRNLNKRSEINFWNHFLTNDLFKHPKESWFDNFIIKPMKTNYLKWTSKTVELDQERLDLMLESE